MEYKTMISGTDKMPKIWQVVNNMIKDIEKGVLKKDAPVPSINVFAKSHGISRDTVEKAYNKLKEMGFLVSVPAKGYFVGQGKKSSLKILMILNKMSSYKKQVYEAFLEKLGGDAQVDLQIHHYNIEVFRNIINENKGKYHFYAVMPHFEKDCNPEDYLHILKGINPSSLIILDKKVDLPEEYISVFQDFELDIFEAFEADASSFSKYDELTIIFPEMSNHPYEIINGVRRFCEIHGKDFKVSNNVASCELKAGHAFVVLTENDLGDLVKKTRSLGLIQGSDIGIISFNETVLKELLEITVVTTDFSGMGRKAAEMVLAQKTGRIRNNFNFIRRGSL